MQMKKTIVIHHCKQKDHKYPNKYLKSIFYRCDDGLIHTACDHYLEFAQDCGEDPEFIQLSALQKRLILDLHNIHRNKIAAGKLPGYAPASRMPVLRWNEDLAYVAGNGYIF